jgi:MFS superfamily sulfate permease-like transporter
MERNFGCANFNPNNWFKQSAVPGRYYNKWLALTGCVLCLLIMFIVNWWAALVTLVVVTILYKYVEWMKPDANWGSASQVSGACGRFYMVWL